MSCWSSKTTATASGVRFYLLLKQLMNTLILRVISLRLVPLHQNLMLLGFGKHRQVRYSLLWIGNDPFKQNLEVPQKSRNRRFVKQVSAVLQRLLGVQAPPSCTDKVKSNLVVSPAILIGLTFRPLQFSSPAGAF